MQAASDQRASDVEQILLRFQSQERTELTKAAARDEAIERQTGKRVSDSNSKVKSFDHVARQFEHSLQRNTDEGESLQMQTTADLGQLRRLTEVTEDRLRSPSVSTF